MSLKKNPQLKIRNPKSLIVICGPTAVGKTAAAIALAKHFNTEIISADSRQFYKEMNIGTAKPDAEELAAAPHHFINNLSIQDTYTAGVYEKDALQVLNTIFEAHDTAVMVGGSGLFIRAVCEGFDEFKTGQVIDEDIINKIKAMPLEDMQAELAKLDPEFYEQVDRLNPRRLQRALEVIYITGKKYSEQRIGTKAQRDFNIIKIGLELPREVLYERINQRVDKMMEAGQWEEAVALYPFRHLQPLQTVGYQEIFDAIDGKLTKQEAIEKIKQNTRHYAKRQMTWFKKDEEVKWHWGTMKYFVGNQEFSFTMDHVVNGIISFLEWGLKENEEGILNFFAPPKYKSHSWNSIENHYIDLIKENWKLGKMLELVQYIQSSGLSERLNGITSLWMLRVSTDKYIGSINSLGISIEGPNMRISTSDINNMDYMCTFTYKSYSVQDNFQEVCDLDSVIGTFKEIISKLDW